jgi:predicted methyltransferase
MATSGRKPCENVAPVGYFEVSKPHKTMAALDGWRKHFMSKGIDTKIVRNCAGHFILCREGVEAKA